MKCILLLVLLFAGCTSTYVKYGTFEFERVSFLQSIDVRATCDTNGVITIVYGNDGGSAAAKGAAAGVLLLK